MTLDSVIQRLHEFPAARTGVGALPGDIDGAEQALHLRIRGSYREFLLRVGWADFGSYEIYGLGPDVPGHLELVKITFSERQEMRPRLAHHLMPVMNDGAGNLYCLDTSHGVDEPHVVFWCHDDGDDQDQVPEDVSSSFEAWLMSLLGDVQ